jgi:hypothetical protein
MPQWPEEMKGGKGGGKGDKKENNKTDKKVFTKLNYLCVAYLGESLDAKVNEEISRCPKGEAKCFYVHRKASSITRIDAEEAMVKSVESDMKRAIQRKIAEFTYFKK